MTNPQKRANRIFISYRRGDSPSITGRIYDRLVQAFGKEAVFKDIDSIPLGVNFRQHIDSTIKVCDAVLVVIGDRWLTETKEAVRRRLDDPNDFVRVEIESALQRNIRVIPLLVQNAEMPFGETLPESLRELTARHGMPIGNDPHFHDDVDRLIKDLEIYFNTVCDPDTKATAPQTSETQQGTATAPNTTPAIDRLNAASDNAPGRLSAASDYAGASHTNAPHTPALENASSTDALRHKSVWWRKLNLAGLLGYVLAALMGVGFILYAYGKKPPSSSVELVTREELRDALRRATNTILASGFALDAVDADLINDRAKSSNRFTARVLLVDPLKTNVVCMRERDENNYRTYSKLLLKIGSFRDNCRSLLGNRLVLGVVDSYPTMSVLIVDDDLYAYFYPYGGYGTSAPVLKLKNYLNDERARFFSSHLDELFKKARQLSTDADFQPYKTADLNLQCPPETQSVSEKSEK